MRLYEKLTHLDLEGFVEPEHRARGHVADPVQVTRDKVGLIQPAAEHIIGLISHTGQQSVVLYRSKTTKSIKNQLKVTVGMQSMHVTTISTQTEDCNLSRGGVMWAQVDP